jgi:hypothetical protein
VRVAQKIKVTLNSIHVENAADAGGNQIEVYGVVTVAGTSLSTLFSKTSSNAVQIAQGASYGSPDTPLGEAVISVRPQAGETIRVRANLTDKDPLFGDDALGDETVSAAFETGWRRDVTVLLTGSGSRVKVNLSLAPI